MAKGKKDDETEVNTIPEQEKPHKAKKEKASREQELEMQLAEKDDRYLRLAAEYDNFRKRTQREKEEIFKSSKATVVSELLPIIDNFERAEKNTTESLCDYKKGMEMTYSQFLAVIKKLGIETFGEAGDPFDPNIHCAVMHIEDENLGDNVIAQVLSKGYKIGDKVIRGASVAVAN